MSTVRRRRRRSRRPAHCAARRAEALAGGGGLRLAIHPCDFLSWLPASAALVLLLQLQLFERQFQPSTRSVYSDNRLHNTYYIAIAYVLAL